MYRAIFISKVQIPIRFYSPQQNKPIKISTDLKARRKKLKIVPELKLSRIKRSFSNGVPVNEKPLTMALPQWFTVKYKLIGI